MMNYLVGVIIMSYSGYSFVAQMGMPYNSCWSWNNGGTQFAGRASRWKPVTPNDQDLRCLPEVYPSEVQVLNSAPLCSPAQCSGCSACKQKFMNVLNGYVSEYNIDTRNPLIGK